MIFNVNEEELKSKDYTLHNRKIAGMGKALIMDYLGLTKQDNEKWVNRVLLQAKELEKQLKGKKVDYCLLEDYYDNGTMKILNKTEDLVIYQNLAEV